MNDAQRKLAALKEKELEAFRSQAEDMRGWLWDWDFTHGRMDDDYLDGPPPGWTPTLLSDTQEGS